MTASLAGWTPRPRPQPAQLVGATTKLVAFDPEPHGAAIWQALGGDGPEGANARIHFFPDAPYRDAEHFTATYTAFQKDWHTMVICDAQWGLPRGMASFMRIRPEHGSVEIGAVAHGHAIARTPVATEAHYLLAQHVFEDLGYRRYEWKLNADNEPSHRAARRLGFTFEGTFRQDMVTGGTNRDTAWYSMLDSEWPTAKRALEAWLSPDNFDPQGNQRSTLEGLRAETG
ncbi:MAG: GNAT family N-acetyltransferase [Devosiaceae bacterium]|nr:GNAT family N-acetyltransferase [Devosiaceae bacterium MH13]